MARRVMQAGILAGAILAMGTLPAIPAMAGGGCHAGPTQGRGDRVDMMKACFTPSILRVQPGTEVTFTNRDPIVHNVSANGWGEYQDLRMGDSFTATFTEPGVYPFACMYHAGMTGAIVVGDGTGAGSGPVVPIEPASDTAGTSVRSASSSSQGHAETGNSIGWALGGVVGLVLGAGLTLFLRRRAA